MIQIAITNEQSILNVDEDRLRSAIRTVLEDAGRSVAQISLAVVDDPTIHQLNRKFLNHDYATDVLSFVLEEGTRGEPLEGEVIASAETAVAAAERFGWPAADELLLYVVHGALHLVGYDDNTPEATAQMRTREADVLARFGLEPCYQSTGQALQQASGTLRRKVPASSSAPDISEGDFST